MRKKPSCRRVPISAVAITAFAVLGLFEVLVIGGVYKVKASRVARVAPWAYEPFLKLVGEHPKSATLRNSVGEQPEQEVDALSGIAAVADFNPNEAAIDVGAQPEEAGEIAPVAETPDGGPSNTSPSESSVTNPVPDRPVDVVPVG